MFLDTWFIILAFLVIAWVSWVSVFNHKRAHPPLPPGPLGFPVVGSIPFLDPELHSYLADLIKSYGPIITLRLGKKVCIAIGSPSIAKEILKDHDVIFANRDVPVADRETSHGGSDILWTPYGPEWRMLRKVCVRDMLSSANLSSVYDLRKHEIHQMIEYLNQRSGTAVNLGDQMFVTMMNVVTNMLWGGALKGEERAKLGAEFRLVVTEFTDMLGAPNVSDFFPAIARFDLQGIVKKIKGTAKKFDDILEDVIDRRRKMANFDVGKDFLQVLMELKDSSVVSKMPFTMDHLKSLLMDMIVAGTDTTSNTIEFAMAEIVNKPEVMRRAQRELETKLGSSKALFEESDILQLPYLLSIVKEAMRLHPVLPLLVPHSPSEACVVGGYTIPKDSKVLVNVWAIHRDPSLWEDPLEFKPERFLDATYDLNGNDFTYLPFGSGRRICAGIAMAERMLLYALASLLHNFDWKLPDGVVKVDLDEKFGITLKKRTSLLLIPSPRSSKL